VIRRDGDREETGQDSGPDWDDQDAPDFLAVDESKGRWFDASDVRCNTECVWAIHSIS
jgi:hypothetical protein